MTERLKKLCARLSTCKRFIDVGCDHGYCTAYMLERRLCERAVIADVSAKSLSKAERLLSSYISEGLCSAVCCDGLEGIAEEEGDLVLVAGMGGDEILKILKNAYIPQSFVFQPMKNSRGLREFLIESGCAIDYDGVFTETRGEEVKHYFLMRGRRTGGTPLYGEYELAFGRDSIGTPELARLVSDELEKNAAYAKGTLSPASRREVEQRIEFLKGVPAR